MEHPLITAVTHSTDEARITLTGVPDRPGVAAADLPRARRRELQRRHDHPERAARGGPRRRGLVHGRRARTCAPPSARSSRSRAELGIAEIDTDPEIGKVSIVGAGMRSHPGVAAKVFETLGGRGDQHRDDLHLADQDLLRDPLRGGAATRSQALHEAFELSLAEVQRERPIGQEAR